MLPRTLVPLFTCGYLLLSTGVLGAPLPALKVVSGAAGTDLEWVAQPGIAYRVLESTDLVNWSVVDPDALYGIGQTLKLHLADPPSGGGGGGGAGPLIESQHFILRAYDNGKTVASWRGEEGDTAFYVVEAAGPGTVKVKQAINAFKKGTGYAFVIDWIETRPPNVVPDLDYVFDVEISDDPTSTLQHVIIDPDEMLFPYLPGAAHPDDHRQSAEVEMSMVDVIDGADTRLRVYLLPVEVRVRQDDVPGPHGSSPMYLTAKPENGAIKGELFALWKTEEAYVTIGGKLGQLLDQGEAPENLVAWSSLGLEDKTDEKEYKVVWGDTGLKEVELQIEDEVFVIRFNVPDTGTMKLNSDELRDEVGDGALFTAGITGFSAKNNVEVRYGESADTGGAKQDAIRHATWNALTAEELGKEITLKITKANEHTGRLEKSAFASNATMDLFDNDFGAGQGEAADAAGIERGTVDWILFFEPLFDGGELRAWTPPDENVSGHDHMLRKSNQSKIFDE